MTGTPGAGKRAAIVGSGPAGFYAADFLLKAGFTVDLCTLSTAPAVDPAAAEQTEKPAAPEKPAKKAAPEKTDKKGKGSL